MATVNITYKPWEHTCGDGCCYSWGVNATVTVGAFTYNIEAGDEDGVLRDFIEKHYGDAVVTDYEYEDEGEDYEATL